MRISRNTIDKLGVKLYDKAADVVSELISNSYDADAEKVTINMPLNVYLAKKQGDKILSENYKIIVEDDGHGFSTTEANNFYLKVGTDRRKDPKRGKWGTRSPEHKRPVMGRKGIGKLAAFGICKTIEVWSSSGKKNAKSFTISHFILNYDDITKDTDNEYHPKLGKDDGKKSQERGTKITLSDFLYKRIPDRDTFMRQLSRKFGIGSPDFEIRVHDTIDGTIEKVSSLHVDILNRTKIDVDNRPVIFDSKKLKVKGWVAYSKYSYRNEEMAGVRIYARGKLATMTRDFGHKAGFTGEFTVRTYLIGEIHADWLDDDKDDDLIASDRQDILWSSEKGEALKEWGKKLLEELGKKSVGPLGKRAYEIFKEKSQIESFAHKRFGNTPVYDAALEVGKKLAGSSSMASLQNPLYVKSLLELILAIAPHKMIVDKLKEIADEGNTNALEVMSTIFGDVKLAETASLGQIAVERIRAIDKLEQAIRKRPHENELKLQEILENTPWLIEPQWTVLQANQTFENFREAFEQWYEDETTKKIQTKFDPKNQTKRPDFIMIHVGRKIEVIEIKKPGHTLDANDFERLHAYIEKMNDFRSKNKHMDDSLPVLHVTLVCDNVNLTGSVKTAYESLIDKQILDYKTWEELLADTKQAHEDFLGARNTIFKSMKKETKQTKKLNSSSKQSTNKKKH